MNTLNRDNFRITTDPQEMDIDSIHQYLSKEAYWCRGISYDLVKKSIENSLAFGILHEREQAGFARVITDYATFAYLADVFVLPQFRGRGLSKWLMSVIMEHPDLQRLRRWSLATKDAHDLYRQFGWNEISNPGLWMEIHRPDIYQK